MSLLPIIFAIAAASAFHAGHGYGALACAVASVVAARLRHAPPAKGERKK